MSELPQDSKRRGVFGSISRKLRRTSQHSANGRDPNSSRGANSTNSSSLFSGLQATPRSASTARRDVETPPDQLSNNHGHDDVDSIISGISSSERGPPIKVSHNGFTSRAAFQKGNGQQLDPTQLNQQRDSIQLTSGRTSRKSSGFFNVLAKHPGTGTAGAVSPAVPAPGTFPHSQSPSLTANDSTAHNTVPNAQNLGADAKGAATDSGNFDAGAAAAGAVGYGASGLRSHQRPGMNRLSSGAHAGGLSDDEFDDDDDDESDRPKSMVLLEKFTHAHSALLIEAADDTPSFRASAEYIDVQVMQLEQWLHEYSVKSARVASEIDRMKGSVNAVISHFMPSVTHHNILAQDYTTLLFGRYTEAESIFWTQLIATVKRNSTNVENMFTSLKDGVFARYKECRSEYLASSKDIEAVEIQYGKLPSHAEPAAVRDASLKLWKYYKTNIHMATKLVLAISELESEVSLQLLDVLSSQFVGTDNGFFHYDQAKLEICTELYRLRTFAANLRATLPGLVAEMKRLRNQVLENLKRQAPPSDVNSYEGPMPSINIDKFPLRKVGWVNVLVDKDHWERYWGYIQNGLFGFLGLSTHRTSVVESSRLVIKSSEFNVLSDKERGCVFSIGDGKHQFIVQATGKHDLAQWQAAFGATIRSPGFDRYFPRELSPWSKQFSIPALTFGIAPESDYVTKRIHDLKQGICQENWLRYDSTLTPKGASALGSTVPEVRPLATSAVTESVIASSFFKPEGFPNALTANFWGSVGLIDEAHPPARSSHYDNKYPQYPAHYPRALVVQDIGMRSVCYQLRDEDRPANDDFLVMFLRVTSELYGCEVPARIYVTGRKLVFYACWNGIVALQSISIEHLLQIDSTHGIDYSELRFTAYIPNSLTPDDDPQFGMGTSFTGGQNVDNLGTNSEGTVISVKMYIDSSALAERRLAFVLQNSRSRNPLSCVDLIEPLGIISVEYAEAVKKNETQLESDLVIRPRSRNRTDISRIGTVHPSSSSLPEYQPRSFGEWLLQNSIGSRNSLGEEDAFQFGKGMTAKYAQDTFPINAETLFTTIFGPKSPVFAGCHAVVTIESQNSVGPWYRRAQRIERRISQKFYMDHTNVERFNYQKLEKVEADLFVVTERRCSWEMPHGEQFHLVFKYVVYATEQGSHLQIWGRVAWKTKNISNAAEQAAVVFAKQAAQGIQLRIRDAARDVDSTAEALERFGPVKATKVINKAPAAWEDFQVTHVSTRSLASILGHTSLTGSLLGNLIKIAVTYIFHLASPLLVLLLVLAIGSLYANVVLYRHSSYQYWRASLEQKDIDNFIKTMKLLPDSDSIFARAVYTKEIDELVSLGTGWKLPDAITHEHGCAAKFANIAAMSMWNVAHGSFNQLEPRAQAQLDEISKMRLDYATKRNDMMTLIRILNDRESEELHHMFQQWLINESYMCSKVRPAVQMLNETVLEEIKLYCLTCLEETKNLL